MTAIRKDAVRHWDDPFSCYCSSPPCWAHVLDHFSGELASSAARVVPTQLETAWW